MQTLAIPNKAAINLILLCLILRVLTTKTCMLPELQETVNATTDAVQTTAVGYFQGALFRHHAVVSQKSC